MASESGRASPSRDASGTLELRLKNVTNKTILSHPGVHHTVYFKRTFNYPYLSSRSLYLLAQLGFLLLVDAVVARLRVGAHLSTDTSYRDVSTDHKIHVAVQAVRR